MVARMDVVHRFPTAQQRSAPGAAPRADEQQTLGALQDLNYIRRCLENAGSFTGVPGLGAMLVGSTAIVATLVASMQVTNDGWVRVWIVEAFIALALGISLMVRKTRRAGASLARGPGRRFGLSMLPAAIAAAAVTVALARVGAYGVLPGLWLMLYGASVVTGGAFSIRVVSVMGASFMVMGAVALFVEQRDVFMGLGFGGLHLVFGDIIRRRHGG